MTRRGGLRTRCAPPVDDGRSRSSCDDLAALDLLAGLLDFGEHVVVRDCGFNKHFLLFERDVVRGDAYQGEDGTDPRAGKRDGSGCSESIESQYLEGCIWTRLSRRVRDQALRHVPSVFLSTRSIAPEQPLHVMTWNVPSSSAKSPPQQTSSEGLTTLNLYVDFGAQKWGGCQRSQAFVAKHQAR